MNLSSPLVLVDPFIYLREGVCPQCFRKLVAKQAYVIGVDTCFTRLTSTPAQHYPCAIEELRNMEPGNIVGVWIVQASSSDMPTARRAPNEIPGEKDWFDLQHTPTEIQFWHTGQHATRIMEKGIIQDWLFQGINHAMNKADSKEEIDAITDQVAWLHKYLPKPSKTAHVIPSKK